MSKTLMILIAGPYRSGTGDNPEKMAANVKYMESFALPLLHLAGSQQVGNEAYREIFHPIAKRILEKCDAVLRVGGDSEGADMMVEVAQRNDLQIYMKLEEIPAA